MKQGFSLVELSIVLMIVGMLTGGILLGQNLIRASELRSVPTDIQRHVAAVNAFRDQYRGLPGDLADATLVWGKNAVACNSDPGTAQTTGVCNGNGNGLMGSLPTASSPSEVFQFWAHLARAGLVEGEYTGVSGATAYYEATVNVNAPPTKVTSVVILPIPLVANPTLSNGLGGAGTNTFWGTQTMGRKNWLSAGAIATGWPLFGFLSPEEAKSIDNKVDDGEPASGQVLSMGCTTYTPLCMVDGTGTAPGADCNAFAATAKYNLTNTTKACALLFHFR